MFAYKNDKNIPIQNIERLKQRLFEKIRKAFNDRLDASRDPSNYQFTDDYKKRIPMLIPRIRRKKV